MNKTRDKIHSAAKHLFSLQGDGGLSMRSLSTHAGISLSVAYHYYKNKDALLRAVFQETSASLGEKRSTLPRLSSTHDMLYQRIGFQFDHMVDIIFVLKYYLKYRDTYAKNNHGYLPSTAHLHIKEVLVRGIKDGEVSGIKDLDAEAKIITHSINGFLLEYFPQQPTGDERHQLLSSITDFMMRSLQAANPAPTP